MTTTPRHTDAVLREMSESPMIGMRIRASVLERLTDPAQRDEAVGRMYRLMNRVALKPSIALADAVDDILAGRPEYRTDLERAEAE